MADDVDLDALAEKCPSNLTGADFYALCSDAMLNRMKHKIQQLEAGNHQNLKLCTASISSTKVL